MDRLKQISENRLQRIQTDFTRFLTGEIDWEARMIGISGARGAGKTTMVLQYIKTRLPANAEALYASLNRYFCNS